ncbi:hypothetical protein [Marinitoga sp. 38H-ov]|uniref:hypothetical protein n=1 Tax=Marinitoga sp. 38H-ov TaxID=1755814 RepID=UPI0013EA4102|nr:hypothetical protein [Marinitoga sp. 38H-ov]KAF2957055.1 hypothetical protein AS160_03475 [Marinitoga sp. 38H-ov]
MNEYRTYILISLIIISISIFFIIKILNESSDLITIASLQEIPLEIENSSNDIILINEKELGPNKKININLKPNEKLLISNNTGTVIIYTFEKIYKIKLKSFEVVMENGEN